MRTSVGEVLFFWDTIRADAWTPPYAALRQRALLDTGYYIVRYFITGC